MALADHNRTTLRSQSSSQKTIQGAIYQEQAAGLKCAEAVAIKVVKLSLRLGPGKLPMAHKKGSHGLLVGHVLCCNCVV